MALQAISFSSFLAPAAMSFIKSWTLPMTTATDTSKSSPMNSTPSNIKSQAPLQMSPPTGVAILSYGTRIQAFPFCAMKKSLTTFMSLISRNIALY